MVHLSSAQWAVLVAFSILWAGIGYALSEKDRRTLGRTPWGLPSALWAFFWFLSLVLGLILCTSSLIRRYPSLPAATAVSRLSVGGPSTTTGLAPTRAPTVGELFPSYPMPANSPPVATDPSSELPPAPVPPDPDANWPQSPPAWHPDPSGRFHYRWWDGSQWTSQVSTDGRHRHQPGPADRPLLSLQPTEPSFRNRHRECTDRSGRRCGDAQVHCADATARLQTDRPIGVILG